MRRVLVVSPYFPPSTLAGVHRARLLANHLYAHGWEPTILCVHERHHQERLDWDLAGLVSDRAQVVKVGALPRRLMRGVGVGDLSLRSYPFLRRAARRLLLQTPYQVLLVTMSPYYTSLLGAALKRQLGIPLVLDYQDPWVSPWGAAQPRLSKNGISHLLATRLEPRAIRWADHVTSVSEGTNEGIRVRYPGLASGDFTAIPIGGDPADFEALRVAPVPVPGLPLFPDRVHLSYVGTLLPRAGGTLKTLLLSLRRVVAEQPELGRRLQLDFVGTSNQPGGVGRYQVLPLARELGVAEQVREIPQRVPYLQALSILARSHANLALGSDERHYTASKLYPLLLSGTPLLAVYHEASSVCDIVKQTGGAVLVSFGDQPGVEACEEALAAALERLVRHPETVPPVRQDALAPWCAEGIAGQFAKVFDQVAAAGPGGPRW